MQSTIYQLRHPWHWLTYGTNATALATVAALLGLIGLYFYVRYTKVIMNATLLASQASSLPVLHAINMGLRGATFEQLNWKISNVGKGAAKNIAVWRIEEGNRADTLLGKWQTLPWNERAVIIGSLMPETPIGSEVIIRYPPPADNESFLIIISCEDNVGNVHQYQVLSYRRDAKGGMRTYTLPPRPLGRESKRIGWRTFKHGQGRQVGVDLNLFNVDGSPHVPSPRPSLIYRLFPFIRR